MVLPWIEAGELRMSPMLGAAALPRTACPHQSASEAQRRTCMPHEVVPAMLRVGVQCCGTRSKTRSRDINRCGCMGSVTARLTLPTGRTSATVQPLRSVQVIHVLHILVRGLLELLWTRAAAAIS